MTRSTTLQFVKDGLIVAVTFFLLGLLVFPFLWVVLTSVRPSSELFSNEFELISANFHAGKLLGCL